MTRSGFVATLVGLLGVVLFGFSIPANACKWLPPDPHKVADHFDVSVEGFAGPVPGIEIAVKWLNKSTNEYEPATPSVTDSAGVAHFQNLQPGKYSVSTNLPVDNDFVDVIVTKNTRQPREGKIALHWPNRRVFRARHLQGTLASFDDGDDPSVALEGIRVTLLEGYSGREIGTQFTAPDGGFAFAGLSPGLYFLRLTEGAGNDVLRSWGRHDVHGDIPIELNPTDPEVLDRVALQIAMSNCGFLIYKDAR
jgi:hypothetical protein